MQLQTLKKIYTIEENIVRLKYEIELAKERAVHLNNDIDRMEDKRNRLELAFYPLVHKFTEPLRKGEKITK